MKPLDFSPLADDKWAYIVEHDRKLAEAIDHVFDRIESGALPGQMFDNHARFTTVRVHGRDEAYAVVWQVRDDHFYVVYVGRSPVG